MGKLAKKLDDMNADDIWFATPEEDYLSILDNEREIAREEGLEEGIAKGKYEGQKEIAKKMIKEKIPKDLIEKCIGMSIEKLGLL